MHRPLIIFLLLAVCLLACKSKPNNDQLLKATEAESAKASVIALQQQWVSNFKNRDAAGLANLFTEDAVRMPDNAATTIGRQSLEAAYRQEFSGVWRSKFDILLTTDEVVVAGDYAFARGRDTLTEEKDGKTIETAGKWMATYRRQPDGAWKYFWSTYNNN